MSGCSGISRHVVGILFLFDTLVFISRVILMLLALLATMLHFISIEVDLRTGRESAVRRSACLAWTFKKSYFYCMPCLAGIGPAFQNCKKKKPKFPAKSPKLLTRPSPDSEMKLAHFLKPRAAADKEWIQRWCQRFVQEPKKMLRGPPGLHPQVCWMSNKLPFTKIPAFRWDIWKRALVHFFYSCRGGVLWVE